MLKKIILFTVFIVFATAVVYAAPADTPKTGQVTSYDTGTIDDGGLQRGVAWPSPRFTAGTGTEVDCVTDNLTGLMWVKAPESTTRIWQAALDYADGLDLCGHTDWRLPNLNELESLVHAEYTNTTLCGGAGCSDNAAWLNSQGYSNVQAGYYWSSGTSVGGTYAWVVDMSVGYVLAFSKTGLYYVWPVRSGQ